MATYVPNALDATQPTEDKTVESAALEFRTIKVEVAKIDTVYGGMAAITTVANDLNEPVSEIETVAASITNVNTVGSAITNVNTVAGSVANVNATAAAITNVNAVGADLLEPVSEINTVATSIAAVDTVGANIAAVSTVAGISANVTTVAGVAANVTTVAGISANVTAVAGNATNINTVAGNNANVTAVGGAIASVNTVAGNTANVNTVAANTANVTAVGTNIASVNSAATNMSAIIAAPAQASAAAASAAAAAASLDNFDDRYLGVKSVAPILDNDGNALFAGELYFNDGTIIADDKGMWVYDGSTWLPASSASQAILVEYKYVATAGQTVFTGADANALVLSYTVGSIIVTLNGSKLLPQDYTASNGTSIVLAVAAALNEELNIVAFSTFDIANTYTQAQADVLLAGKLSTSPGAVGNTNLAANAVSLDKLARVGTAGQVLMSGGPSADPSYATMSNSYTGKNAQLFTGSGTFTVPAGVSNIKVTVIGGGGGSSNTYGGQGGMGGVAVGYYSVTAGAAYTVTVGGGGASVTSGTGSGAGGTSSFGALISATGGAGRTGSGYPTNGLGSGGTLVNFRLGATKTNTWINIGPFMGYSFRFPSSTAQSTAAVAWSPSLVGAYSGDDLNTMVILPGAPGAVWGYGCVSYVAGGVGGVVLVEW